MARLLLVAVLTLSLAPYASSSPIAPQFYRVKVQLTGGKVIEGYSWGVSWIGGASIQERKVKGVALKVENETVIATFTFLGDDNPLVVRESAKDDKGAPRKLAIGSSFEVFHKGVDFYWVKDIAEYSLGQVFRIDTLQVLGQGLRVSDPRNYLNLREPFIVVEDCGLGCETKMYSKNPHIDKTTLQRLWDQHFACGRRSEVNQELRGKVRDQYHIEWLTDPFCHD
jgi:hypothetical protein